MTGDLSDAAYDGASRLLNLLRRQADGADLAAVAGVRPDDVAAGLEIHRLLVERHRREVALTALYDTVGDLSSLRDLQTVLDAICRRARALLHSDVAYLMLNDDERGDTYMRATDGIETDAFKSVRLAMGAGLGGLVAQTAQPYCTADYVNDPRFVHRVDEAVGGERLVAILGVPLRIRDRVIGVLFAANRVVRRFTDDEVTLLGTLAKHAAIAIETAQLFEDVQRAVADLTRVNELVREHSASVERAAELHERLTRLVVRGGGLAALADTVADVLDATLLVLDPSGHVRAMAQPGGGTDIGPAEWLRAHPGVEKAALAIPDGRAVSVSAPVDGGRVWIAPVRAGAEPLGALVLGRDKLDEADLRGLERAALVTAVVLLGERSVAEAELRTRGELLDDLLSAPRRDVEALRRRTALLGVDLDEPHVVVVARLAESGHPPTGGDRPANGRAGGRPVASPRRRLAGVAADVAGEWGGLSGEHGGAVVLIVRHRDAGEAARVVGARLTASIGQPVTVGAAGPAAGPEQIGQAYRDAVQCQHVLRVLGREGDAASPADVGFYGLLFSQAGRDELTRFVRRTIGPLLDYDRDRGSELFRTVLTYFTCDANLARTAAALYIHVNTLYQRLDRVAQVLGDGWRKGDQALQVHLAARLHQLASEEGSRSMTT